MVLFPAPAGPSMAMISLREEESLIGEQEIVHAVPKHERPRSRDSNFAIRGSCGRLPAGRMNMFGAIEAGGTKFVCGVGSGPEDLKTSEIQTTSPMHCGRSYQIPAGKFCGQGESGGHRLIWAGGFARRFLELRVHNVHTQSRLAEL